MPTLRIVTNPGRKQSCQVQTRISVMILQFPLDNLIYLSSFLDILLADKPLSVYNRKQITKEFPRPNVESIFTPVLDNYLGSLVTGAKAVNKEAKKLQDQLLDTVGQLSLPLEHVSSWQANKDT